MLKLQSRPLASPWIRLRPSPSPFLLPYATTPLFFSFVLHCLFVCPFLSACLSICLSPLHHSISFAVFISCVSSFLFPYATTSSLLDCPSLSLFVCPRMSVSVSCLLFLPVASHLFRLIYFVRFSFPLSVCNYPFSSLLYRPSLSLFVRPCLSVSVSCLFFVSVASDLFRPILSHAFHLPHFLMQLPLLCSTVLHCPCFYALVCLCLSLVSPFPL